MALSSAKSRYQSFLRALQIDANAFNTRITSHRELLDKQPAKYDLVWSVDPHSYLEDNDLHMIMFLHVFIGFLRASVLLKALLSVNKNDYKVSIRTFPIPTNFLKKVLFTISLRSPASCTYLNQTYSSLSQTVQTLVQ